MRVFILDGPDARRRVLDELGTARGVYALVLRVDEPAATAEVGALGRVRFAPGCYCYVGSAQGGLGPRLARHLRAGRKRMRWHVDYLRRRAEPVAVAVWTDEGAGECVLSRAVAALADGTVEGFGAGDCRCASHLHRFRADPTPRLGGIRPAGA